MMRSLEDRLVVGDVMEKDSITQTKVLVIFVGRTHLRWLRFLRLGFRHCFVVIEDDDGCIVSDPLANRTIIGRLGAVTLEKAQQYCWQQGYTVIETNIGEVSTTRVALMRPFTCVEFVKRVLCLMAPTVVTPWQLYRALRKLHRRVDLGLDATY